MMMQAINQRHQAHQNMLSKDKVRLQNPNTGEFLHLSGEGTTRKVDYSWLGFRHQAETLRERAAAKGKEWPFQPIHRNQLEPTQEEDEV